MRGVNHDRVEWDALLRESDRQLKLRLIGCMVEMNGDGDGSAVCAVSSARTRHTHSRIETVLQELPSTVLQRHVK